MSVIASQLKGVKKSREPTLHCTLILVRCPSYRAVCEERVGYNMMICRGTLAIIPLRLTFCVWDPMLLHRVLKIVPTGR